MKIVTYLSGFKVKDSNIAIAHDDVFEIMRELEGRWCRPFTSDTVGTILFLIQDDRFFCRSVIKPNNIMSIPVSINIEKEKWVKAKIRLPLSEGNETENVRELLVACGCEARSISYNRLPFSSISFKSDGEMIDIPCGDFQLDIKINSLEGFKKAYIQGLGDYKEYGCGMITLNNNQVINEQRDK